MAETESTEVSRITVDELQARLDRGEPIAIIDARSPESWARSDVKIKGAIRVPPHEVSSHLDEIPRDRSVVTYCT